MANEDDHTSQQNRARNTSTKKASPCSSRTEKDQVMMIGGEVEQHKSAVWRMSSSTATCFCYSNPEGQPHA